MTAEIAANLGRDYLAGRSLSQVAKEVGHDRVALKTDLLIVATALQHSVKFFLTGDPGCHAIALHAKLDSRLINNLPDPPPESPIPPPPEPKKSARGLFDDLSE